MGLPTGLRQMLKAPATVESFTGKDTFGNDVYGDPVSFNYFMESANWTYGDEDTNDDRRDDVAEFVGTMICDANGIKAKDRVVVSGVRGNRLDVPPSLTGIVSAVETFKDQQGLDLYQSVTITSRKRD